MSITSVLYLKDEVSIAMAMAGAVDSVIKFWDTRHLKGPVSQACPYYESSAKSVISPDASHVISGSGDGHAYIWQVSKPHMDPITLKSHDGEVTAVGWCPSEIGKVAACSDAFTICFWNIQSSCYSNTISPPSIRKRVMALPRMEHRKLFVEETLSTKSDTKNWTSNDVSHVTLLRSSRMHEISTHESQKKRISFNSEVNKNLERKFN